MSLLAGLLERDGLDYQAESGGWLHVQRPAPEMAGLEPMALLSRSAQLPSNFRYGSSDGAEIVLLGEMRGQRGGADGETVQEEMDERIEAALEASGFAWKRREQVWVVPANERLPREIQIAQVAESVRVEAVLIGWDEIGEVETMALGRLLCRAQFGLRFARCEVEERQTRVAALVESAFVERDLPDSVAGVAAGSRLLAREVGVLLAPEMARMYLAFLNRAS
ncbi:MAG: hypothetical protein ACRELG_02470 [Gemmataceae bacterium]